MRYVYNQELTSMVYMGCRLMRGNSMMNRGSVVGMVRNSSMVNRGYMVGVPIGRGSYWVSRLVMGVCRCCMVNRVDRMNWMSWGMVHVSMMIRHMMRGMGCRVGRLL